MASTKALRFEGCSLFRARIVAAILSGKTLIIKNIRADDQEPGVVDYEASFLRLIDKLLDGSTIEINETGTLLKFKPGIVLGGEVNHECVCSRSIGWYLEGILPILVFAKRPTKLILSGVTNNQLDLSVDTLQVVTIPLLRNFGIEGVSLVVKQRGAAPNGGGVIEFSCPIIRELRPINITESGLVKRVRGIAFCAKMSPTVLTRVVDSARGVLNDYLPDVYINTDHYRGKNSGNSPGFSLALQAETTTGVLVSTERCAAATGGELPEDIGKEAALQLLEEIWKGGVIDRSHQPLVLMMMVLGPEDVCKVRFGSELTDASVECLRLLREAFGVVFKIKEDLDQGHRSLLLSCLGIGYLNMSRKAT